MPDLIPEGTVFSKGGPILAAKVSLGRPILAAKIGPGERPLLGGTDFGVTFQSKGWLRQTIHDICGQTRLIMPCNMIGYFSD